MKAEVTSGESQNSQPQATYDTSALEGDTNIANVAVETIITAKAKMGEVAPQLVKLRMMEANLAEQKKARTKDSKKQTALMTMDDIAASMVSGKLNDMINDLKRI